MDDTDKKITIIKKEADKITSPVGSLLAIKDDKGLKSAADQLAAIRAYSKQVKETKDSIIKPINLSLSRLRDLFREPETKLAQADRDLKVAITAYHDQVQKRFDDKVTEKQDQVKSGDRSLKEAMGDLSKTKQLDTTVRGDSGGVQFRHVRKIRITNAAALPAHYFMHEKVIEVVVRLLTQDVIRDGKKCPPGAEVYEHKVVAGVK